MHSQTSTEYLIISAVVIFIAVLVAAVLGIVPSIGGDTDSGILSAELATQRVGVTQFAVDQSGAFLTLRNNGNEQIQVDTFSLDGVSVSINKKVGPGKEILVYHPSAYERTNYAFDIIVNYTDLATNAQYGLEFDQALSGSTAQGSELFSANVQSASNGDLFDDLIAWLRFEDGLADSSGNGRNGSVQSNHEIVSGGVRGNALRITDQVESELESGEYTYAYNMTTSLWFKIESVSGYPYLYEERASGCCDPPDHRIQIFPNGSVYFRFAWDNLDGQCDLGEYTPSTYKDNQWHHAAITRDHTNITFFIDGESFFSVIDTDCANYYTTSQMVFGYGYDGDSVLVDDFMMFRRALSYDEINELYRLGS